MTIKELLDSYILFYFPNEIEIKLYVGKSTVPTIWRYQMEAFISDSYLRTLGNYSITEIRYKVKLNQLIIKAEFEHKEGEPTYNA